MVNLGENCFPTNIRPKECVSFLEKPISSLILSLLQCFCHSVDGVWWDFEKR